jgi:hypothetical protein
MAAVGSKRVAIERTRATCVGCFAHQPQGGERHQVECSSAKERMMSTEQSPNSMTSSPPQQSVDTLKHRIRLAEEERDSLRSPGDEELYLRAASMVAALELQLEQRLRADR